jgi:hypothetical protein
MTALITSPVVMYGAGGYSFEALIPKFILFKKSTGAFSRFSKNDKEGILWRLASAFGAKSDIRTVSEKLIIETLTSGRFQNIKPITRNSCLSALKSFYTWAYKIEKLTQNHVAREITPFKELKKSDQIGGKKQNKNDSSGCAARRESTDQRKRGILHADKKRDEANEDSA